MIDKDVDSSLRVPEPMLMKVDPPPSVVLFSLDIHHCRYFLVCYHVDVLFVERVGPQVDGGVADLLDVERAEEVAVCLVDATIHDIDWLCAQPEAALSQTELAFVRGGVLNRHGSIRLSFPKHFAPLCVLLSKLVLEKVVLGVLSPDAVDSTFSVWHPQRDLPRLSVVSILSMHPR